MVATNDMKLHRKDQAYRGQTKIMQKPKLWLFERQIQFYNFQLHTVTLLTAYSNFVFSQKDEQFYYNKEMR